MEKKRDSSFLQEKKHKKPNETKGNITSYRNENTNLKKNESDVPVNQNNSDKKPFDKKTYHLKKYSNKYKLEQWEEQRKKKLLHNYYKEMKNESVPGTYKTISFDEDNVDSNQGNIGKFVRHPDLIEKKRELESRQSKTKKDPYWKAKETYNKIKEDKLAKRQGMEKARQDKLQKLQEYKKKKQERYKKLSKKTKKGQPVMTGRMELLLEKLQNS